MIVIKLLSNHEDSYLIQLLSPIYILVIILKGHSKKINTIETDCKNVHYYYEKDRN